MKELIQETADKLGLPYDVVDKVIKTFILYIKVNISKVEYKSLTTFDKVKTNFVIPGFGKLVVKTKTDKRLEYGRIKKRSEDVEH